MFGTDTAREREIAKLHDDIDHGRLQFIEGTLQRIDYVKREVKLSADGVLWEFTLSPGCLFFFDSQPAILRCFHPLDHVHILFIDAGTERQTRSMCAWEKSE